MAQKESSTDIFTSAVEQFLKTQMKSYETQIRSLKKNGSIADMEALLAEANSVISFFCGEDELLYEDLRYRLFIETKTGKFIVLKGEEIDVDFRGWMESGTISGWNISDENFQVDEGDDDKYEDDDGFDDDDEVNF